MNRVYSKEYELLENCNDLLEKKVSHEELYKNFELLTRNFKTLLRKTEKITKISDSLQRKILEEQEKSDNLLLNTLPEKVVNELKQNGTTAPESFDNVTIYFSDLVGFTELSDKLSPSELIEELNDLFTVFDDIMTSHSCERIKTIGDAYMAVCGMPESNPEHALNIVRAAIGIMNYVKERNRNSQTQWEIRIGIHTGKVVGGIVGVRKYIYDVFGDAVNTASRMESNSLPMRINISENTYSIVKDNFICTQRSPVQIKGKGLMNMYFIS